ncbi:MAG: sulfite exporter TauE/SafE family protein [Actinomycetes bacterium]|jgi:uncharacterized membrane protein YfcA
MNLLLLAAAGVAAGAINSVVGSGTLLTYPLLLASGLPPVVANGTNSFGVAPGNAMGAWIYRDHNTERKGHISLLAVAIGLGAVSGAGLVLALPASVFEAIVPWLILVACLLVVVQPRIVRELNVRGIDPTNMPQKTQYPVLFVIGIYAGYFGAAQGIILMAVLATLFDVDLQRSNAAKNVLQAVSNLAAACVFALAGAVFWPAALAVGAGATLGGLVGAPVARRLPASVLRGTIVVVGLVAAVVSLWNHR